MSGTYPSFKSSYSHDELVEHFLLTPADLQLVLTCRGDANRCGMALLLKAVAYLGYVPEHLEGIPGAVRSFIAGQLGLLWDFSSGYPWDSRTRDQHLHLIRQHTGWRFSTAQDKEALEQWLRQSAAVEAPTVDRLFDAACQRLRELRVELPAEGELHRVVNAALSGFFQDIHRRIATVIPGEIRSRMDALLMVPELGGVSSFETLKADPGKPGIDNLQTESMVVSLQTRDSYRRAEGRDGTPVPRVVGRVNVAGGVSHTRWPSRHGLLKQPSWTSPTVRRNGCATPLCQKSQGVDRCAGRPKIPVFASKQAALNWEGGGESPPALSHKG